MNGIYPAEVSTKVGKISRRKTARGLVDPLGNVGWRRVVTTDEALAFVRTHGVVLESASGPVPSLAEAIVGGPIQGSWWGHAQSHEIFVLTRAVRDCPDVLVCRLVGGKITYVHRRLWPALVRTAERFPRKYLAKVHERHTASGKHVSDEVAYPAWVSREVADQARELDEHSALNDLGRWCTKVDPSPNNSLGRTRGRSSAKIKR